MSEHLLRFARNFRIDKIQVPFEELIGSDVFLNELGEALCTKGWPSRKSEEIRQELLRINARWTKLKFGCEASRERFIDQPSLWIEESEDEDDIFMPPFEKKARAAWEKEQAKKAKKKASSKGKDEASSKGKGEASVEDDDDDFMPPFGKKPRVVWEKEQAKGKGKGKGRNL